MAYISLSVKNRRPSAIAPRSPAKSMAPHTGLGPSGPARRGEAPMSLLKTLYEKDLYPELEEAGETVLRARLPGPGRRATGQAERSSRRTFLRCAAMLGCSAVVGETGASAQSAAREIVIVNWGGDSIPAYAKAFGEPFEKADRDQGRTRRNRTAAGQDPRHGPVRQGRVGPASTSMPARRSSSMPKGLLQPIDYSIVDKNKVYPGWAYNAGVAFYIYSSRPHFDTSKLKGRSPTAGRISGTSRNSPASAPCARRRRAASRPA